MIPNKLIKRSKSCSNTVIILDSSDDEECKLDSPAATTKTSTLSTTTDHTYTPIENNRKTPRRIKPTLITSAVCKFNNDETDVHRTIEQTTCKTREECKQQRSKTPFTNEFEALLAACRKADPSTDMELLLKRKIVRYYERVHPDFVKSKSFNKAVMNATAEILLHPNLVYMKLTGILEELNIRRNSKHMADSIDSSDTSTVINNENVKNVSNYHLDNGHEAFTGNAVKDQQIKRLNHALNVLKKRIARLDEADVDMSDEENSNFLLVERCKKRACEIYEKICDITGESKHACRSTKKSIVFNGTPYPQFNKTIQTFVNRTRLFPDLFDVRRCLEHCNQQYAFGMSKDEVLRVSQDAFVRIGKLLQRRRKMDLYETVSYFTMESNEMSASHNCDPAENDIQLQRKLAENEEKYRHRINAIINRYAEIQDDPKMLKMDDEKITVL